MRLERLNYGKIKVFLTYDDLSERGLTKEDLWRDSFKVQQLFREMIEQACDELGFQPTSSLSVEVFSLQAQGMVIIVTTKDTEHIEEEEEEDDYVDEYIEMQVTLDESTDVFFEFCTFEDVIQLANRLTPVYQVGGTLYSYENRFYLLIEHDQLVGGQMSDLVALLAEYGHPSTITKYRVHEYGKLLVEQEAIIYIANTFKP
ncbi:genetic competence negative regulator [Metabacillus iocasae]|uniref:Adapter protein MecA n=1 Tax=Priestia iocasae TaxID=2291674 RepID=A0ABS2QQG2_9BACI|nr:genetic competence negative regulator [Metabacillus iocasae]MBM7701696.1 adapter protein MecA 1/2 [Metabacillus iocasae]